jgi:peptidoglycan-associated lipoprotein
MRSSLCFSLSSLLIIATSAACSHEQPPKTAENVGTATVSVTQPTSATVTTKSDQVVNVGPSLRQACGIDDTNQAPKFDFDQSTLAGNDRDVLSKVATCLTTGPMKGHNISLVGRADPRGETEYNMNLGEHRAGSTKAYLQKLGVDGARIMDTSRGALDATGHNEETWRIDRRVDIELAN